VQAVAKIAELEREGRAKRPRAAAATPAKPITAYFDVKKQDQAAANEQDANNAALAAGDQAAIMNSLKGLQYDFMMQNGYEPRLTGGRAPSNEVRGFASRYQVTEAMSDPRYEKDAGYRQEVERRIAASADSIFGYQG
jgi:hypothetical protein